MLNIDEILQKVDEQKTFKIDVEEYERIEVKEGEFDENEDVIEVVTDDETRYYMGIRQDWSFRIKRPTDAHGRKWSNIIYQLIAKFPPETEGQENSDERFIRVLLEEQELIWPIVKDIAKLAISWEGIEGEFSQEKLLKYFQLYPGKAGQIAFDFSIKFQNWRNELKKRSEPLSNG